MKLQLNSTVARSNDASLGHAANRCFGERDCAQLPFGCDTLKSLLGNVASPSICIMHTSRSPAPKATTIESKQNGTKHAAQDCNHLAAMTAHRTETYKTLKMTGQLLRHKHQRQHKARARRASRTGPPGEEGQHTRRSRHGAKAGRARRFRDLSLFLSKRHW